MPDGKKYEVRVSIIEKSEGNHLNFGGWGGVGNGRRFLYSHPTRTYSAAVKRLLAIFVLYSTAFQMKRKHSKYQAITFGRVERNPVLNCEGTVIPIQDEMELLGVTIDNKLKFEGQIRKICRKVGQQVAVLNRLKKILPFELRIDIYMVLSLHRISITAQRRGIIVVNAVAPNLKKSMNEPFAL